MKTKIAAAADAAALAGAQLYGSTPAQRNARAQDTFNAALSEMPRVSLVLFTASDVTTAGVYSGFKVEVAATTETFIGKIFGMDTLPLGARAEASLGDGGKLEIALVLDTTGSMAGSKLASLKTAANSLVTNLDNKKLHADQIKYALVPFAQYVNVGLGNRNKPWISVPSDSSTTQNVCWNDYPVTSTTNCRTTTASYMNDGVPVSYQTQTCDYTYGPPVQVVDSSQQPRIWNGCVGSRNYPLNIQDGNYGTPVPGAAKRMVSWRSRALDDKYLCYPDRHQQHVGLRGNLHSCRTILGLESAVLAGTRSARATRAGRPRNCNNISS